MLHKCVFILLRKSYTSNYLCPIFVLYKLFFFDKIRKQVVKNMFKELSNKLICDDFKTKMILTEDEIKVLNMLLLKYSMVKMSQEMCMSDRNVSRIKKDIKEKYCIYKKMELAKLNVFKS